MRAFTQATLRSPAALEADIAAGLRRGMQVEIGQFRVGVACAGMTVIGTGELHQRYVVACALPAPDLMKQAPLLRDQLARTARDLANALLPAVNPSISAAA